ncbi:Polynucleotide 5'-hydroxyl-kinase grc3 [Elasticomyces elasticus]|nr:Polynucleotide 5'-hydroxyl-kinase grc3 [Elasticomyces elasticus]
MAPKRTAADAFATPPGSLSAFAAARARRRGHVAPGTHPSSPVADSSGDDRNWHNREIRAQESASQLHTSPADAAEYGNSDLRGDDQTEEILVRANFELSTWIPAHDARVFKSVIITLQSGQKVTFVGQYDLRVLRGAVTVYGAILSESAEPYRVYAPATHALPDIKALTREAEISISDCLHTLRPLEKFSPLFQKIWNYRASKWEPSFAYIRQANDDPLRRSLYPLVIHASWQDALDQMCSHDGQPVAMICGTKSVGKSTFSRILTNRLMTRENKPRVAANGLFMPDRSVTASIFLLDLDPGQAEYSPPGNLSLIHLRAPNMGPPYTHPLGNACTTARIIRSHTLASTSPKDDPDHFLACALDLKDTYIRLKDTFPSSALIINCPGWIIGSGFDTMAGLSRALPLTHLFVLGDQLPEDLFVQLTPPNPCVVFRRLLGQPVVQSSRTSAQLRTMQQMSYFHSDEPAADGNLRWHHCNIASIPSWTISYGGDSRDVLGFMLYGENVAPKSLTTVLDGGVVAVVVIEDDAAFVPALPFENEYSTTEKTLNDGQVDGFASGHETPFKVLRTAQMGLPCITTNGSTSDTLPLNPRFSHCIGMALIRVIDAEDHTVQLATPIPEIVLADSRPKVLVTGRFDTPSWAYLEAANEFCDDEEVPWLTKTS